MSEFWVNIPELRAAAAEIEAVAQSLESEIAEISRGGSEAGGCLSGGCAAGIAEQLRQLSAQLANGKSNLGSMASALVDICNAYESTDEEAAASAVNCSGKPKSSDFAEVGGPASGYIQYTATAWTPFPKVLEDIFAQSPLYNRSIRDMPQNEQDFVRYLYKLSGKIMKYGTSDYVIIYPNGYAGYAWGKIENVLKKPADKITKEEYLELSALFLDMDNSDATKFLKLLIKPKKTVHVPDSTFSDHNPNDYTVWTVDDEKIQELQLGIMLYSNLYDTYNLDFKYLKEKLGFEKFDLSERKMLSETLGNKQNLILQKAALLDVFSMCGGGSDSLNERPGAMGTGYFTSEENAKGPNISLKTGKNGSIELSYSTDGSYEHVVSKTVTVGKVSDGSLGSRKVIEESNNFYVDRFSVKVDDMLLKTIKSATNVYLAVATGGMSEVVGGAITAVEETLSIVFDLVDNNQLSDKQGQFYNSAIVAENNKDFGLKSVLVTLGTDSSEETMALTYPTGKTWPAVDALNYGVQKKEINLTHYGFPEGTTKITYEMIRSYPQETHNLLIGKPLEKFDREAIRLSESDITFLNDNTYMEIADSRNS